MDLDFWKAIASQGGFAVLAGFLGYLGYKTNQAQQGITAKLLDIIAQHSSATAAQTVKLDSLIQEFAGLRNGVHGIRDLMAVFEKRLYELEKEGRG